MDIDYDLIFGISDNAATAECNASDNHVNEISKLVAESTSFSQAMGESMHDDPVEGEHMDSNTLLEGEHSFEEDNERTCDDVEGEQINDHVEGELNQNNEDFHDINDVCSIAGSENDEMYEDAPLDFDPAYPRMDKWKKDHSKEQIIATIDTSVETGILLPQPSAKKSKKTKKPDVGSSDTKAKSSKKTNLILVIALELDQPKPVAPDTQVIENEIIPSKTGVFKRIKMKSKTKRRSLGTKMVLKQVSHQPVIFREVPTLVSPSIKKRMDDDMAKHISQKKKRKLIISSDSTVDNIEVIPETPEAILSTVDTSVTQPPEVSIVNIVSLESRTSDITVNISDMDTNVIMGENNSKVADQGISLSPQITPIVPITSTTDSPTFQHVINTPFTSIFSS
ncbi:unnamed protein product [Lactuca saligna]|uniref:Uncharacterized protein n=1 Tax=Lactuca saligna TaxID=75948 RepID=A0AA36EN34_LACSI|nr:unnamed protein product [Lactuca saligna]